jgi:hypothetical protein
MTFFSGKLAYTEHISSIKTTALFFALTVICGALLAWRLIGAGSLDVWAAILLFLTLLFLFYTLNFRTLLIQVDQEALRLNFGVFTWRVPRGNIAACRLDDDLPILMRYGGAGIHFMLVHGRYRASFNFLEYPRVVVELQEKVGPVRDISFTTRHPEQVTRLLRGAAPKEV